ncbi:MAG: hypothetical protein VX641_00080 [Planctomycetota bacterium]|nr:hypothetical protein [Planctomycetota bacterium]
MPTTLTEIIPQDMHQLCASSLFNRTLDQLERTDRAPIDDETMLNMAHASLWHWRVVGRPVNWARGEWLVSRVNSVLNRPESALLHAQNYLGLCDEHQLPEYDRAFAHEAVARAHSIGGDAKGVATHVQYGLAAAEHIKNPDDREWVLRNLGSVTTEPSRRHG